ncbi:MAG: HEAT repeat domain-containing protein [Methanomicrobiales archaeon]|nr:HEAT repeat domain-containing protein [Methanomicrobiales archaeon]
MMKESETDEEFRFFIDMLSSPDWDRRYKAAQALGVRADDRAVDPLIRSLKDEDWRVRQKAAWALGNIGDPRALQPLRRLMQDPYDGVQDMARQAEEMIRRKMYR